MKLFTALIVTRRSVLHVWWTDPRPSTLLAGQWEIDACERTVDVARNSIVSLRGSLRRNEKAKMKMPAIDGHRSTELAPERSYPLEAGGRLRPNTPVLLVFRRGADPQIGAPIIERLAIDVVNKNPMRRGKQQPVQPT